MGGGRHRLPLSVRPFFCFHFVLPLLRAAFALLRAAALCFAFALLGPAPQCLCLASPRSAFAGLSRALLSLCYAVRCGAARRRAFAGLGRALPLLCSAARCGAAPCLCIAFALRRGALP